MNTSKTSTSLFRIAAAATLIGAFTLSTSTAAAADAKAPRANAKVVATKAADKVDAKALRRKAKLPRKWVWKKYAKNFDAMYRK